LRTRWGEWSSHPDDNFFEWENVNNSIKYFFENTKFQNDINNRDLLYEILKQKILEKRHFLLQQSELLNSTELTKSHQVNYLDKILKEQFDSNSIKEFDSDNNFERLDDQNELISIFKQHQENLSDKWEQYLYEYNHIFQKFRGLNNLKLLEIGVQNGGSLQIWKKYFGAKSVIHGIDINKEVCKMILGQGITLFCFDASDRIEFQNWKQNNFNYNIIIDDASHIQEHIITAFEVLFGDVIPGGYYVVEDIHTSYWDTFLGGVRKSNTAIEYFKKLIDVINFFHTDNNYKISLNAFEIYCVQNIRSITFVDGMAIIHKRVIPRNRGFKRVMTGRESPVSTDLAIYGKIGNLYLHTEMLSENVEYN